MQPQEQKTAHQYTVACLGDSITYGHGVSATRTRDAWPFVLQRMLGPGCQVLNFGKNGATALRGTPDSYEASGLLDSALSSGADMFILMLGTNDTKDRYWDPEAFRRDYRSIAARILDACGEEGTEGRPAQLVLMLPPKAFADSSGQTAYGVSDERIVNSVIPAVKGTAEEFGLRTADLHALTDAHPEYYLEGVHPNREGNAAIAGCVYEAFFENA